MTLRAEVNELARMLDDDSLLELIEGLEWNVTYEEDLQGFRVGLWTTDARESEVLVHLKRLLKIRHEGDYEWLNVRYVLRTRLELVEALDAVLDHFRMAELQEAKVQAYLVNHLRTKLERIAR